MIVNFIIELRLSLIFCARLIYNNIKYRTISKEETLKLGHKYEHLN